MFATIVDSKFLVCKGIPSLEEAQRAVGGYIETAARFESPNRKNHSVDVYCNEEGMLMDLPINHIINGQRIAGNLIIVVTNENTGEWVEANAAELARAASRVSLSPFTIANITAYGF